MSLYTEKDFVEVVELSTGRELSVPKAWLAKGSPYAEAYVKPGTKAGSKAAEKTQEPEAPSTLQVPGGNTTREDLEAFATEHAGISAEDAAAFGNKDDLRAEIVAKLESQGS